MRSRVSTRRAVSGSVVAGCQHPRQNLQNAERLANLVADQAAEVAELRRLSVDRFAITGNECIDGFLLQHSHGLLRAADHEDSGGRVAPLAEHGCLSSEEGLENLTEYLVFTKQLVDRCALVEAQQSKLGGFRHHGCVGGNFLIRRCAQVGGNLFEQFGNVVEELMARENLTFFDVEQLVEPFEPDLGQRGMVCGQPRGKVFDCGGEVRDGHRMRVSESAECTLPGQSHDNLSCGGERLAGNLNG